MKILLWQEQNPTKGGAESWLDYLAHGLKDAGHEVAWLYSQHIDIVIRDYKPDFVIIGTIHNFIGLQYAEILAESQIPAAWMIHDYWPFCGPRMLMKDHNRSDQRCEANEGVCRNSCGGWHPVPEVIGKFYTVTGCQGAADIMRRNGVRVDAVVEEGVDTSLFRAKPRKRINGSITSHVAWTAPWKGMHILDQAVSV